MCVWEGGGGARAPTGARVCGGVGVCVCSCARACVCVCVCVCVRAQASILRERGRKRERDVTISFIRETESVRTCTDALSNKGAKLAEGLLNNLWTYVQQSTRNIKLGIFSKPPM